MYGYAARCRARVPGRATYSSHGLTVVVAAANVSIARAEWDGCETEARGLKVKLRCGDISMH
jgi:hypothetical protein